MTARAAPRSAALKARPARIRAPYASATIALVESELPGGHSPGYFAMITEPLQTASISWRGDPAMFEGFPDFYFERLPGTADEAWRVAQMVGGRRLTGKKGVEVVVEHEPRRAPGCVGEDRVEVGHPAVGDPLLAPGDAVADDGTVLAYGEAPHLGSASDSPLAFPIVRLLAKKRWLNPDQVTFILVRGHRLPTCNVVGCGVGPGCGPVLVGGCGARRGEPTGPVDVRIRSTRSVTALRLIGRGYFIGCSDQQDSDGDECFACCDAGQCPEDDVVRGHAGARSAANRLASSS